MQSGLFQLERRPFRTIPSRLVHCFDRRHIQRRQDPFVEMALPGLQMNTIPLVKEKTATVTELQQNSEWRFEVAFGEKVEVKVR